MSVCMARGWGKKVLSLLLVLVIAFCLSSCGTGADEGPYFTSTQNILNSEYEEEYSQYTKEIEVQKSTKKIVLRGSVSSGSIQVELSDGSPENSHKFEFSKDFEEQIILKSASAGTWTYKISFNEDTEGSITLELY